MRTHTQEGQRITLVILGALGAATLFAACAQSDGIPVPIEPSGSGAGGMDGAGGAIGTGGAASGSSSSSGAGGSTTNCSVNTDCTGNPGGEVCDTASGHCVECLATADVCAAGSYCDPATNACVEGCTEDADCPMPSSPRCDVGAHTCVACLMEADCQAGTICVGSTCVPGCSPTQACAPGLSCCGSACFDLMNDEEHCGACLSPCTQVPHAPVTCEAGKCSMGACDAAWDNCDLNAATGCEHNVLQDGACLCQPGEFTTCYGGPVGTLGLGPCKVGVTFCEPSGVAWGPCNGQVIPTSEICANNTDEDCDGIKDNVPDGDGDGFSTCENDCCDVAEGACTSPELVNPGAFEVVGNGLNDDCDPATSDTVASAACSSVQDFSGVTASDVAKAMDICQTTTAAPPIAQRKWGLVTSQQLLANGNALTAAQLADVQSWQTAVLTGYGTGGIAPKKGPTMAGVSTGKMRDEGDLGFEEPNGGWDFSWDSTPPAAYLAAHGNKLPASLGCNGTCPAGSGANDSINVRLLIRVPTNAKSFSYDFRFVSAEFWAWTCSNFNDFYLALLQTTAAGIPADKNISFDGQGNPVSVNNGFFDVCNPKGCYDCPGGAAELAGTGMQNNNTGGATKWLTTDAPVTPGETMQLELILFDVTDNVLDSIALLDNFRWSLTPSAVVTHE